MAICARMRLGGWRELADIPATARCNGGRDRTVAQNRTMNLIVRDQRHRALAYKGSFLIVRDLDVPIVPRGHRGVGFRLGFGRNMRNLLMVIGVVFMSWTHNVQAQPLTVDPETIVPLPDKLAMEM